MGRSEPGFQESLILGEWSGEEDEVMSQRARDRIKLGMLGVIMKSRGLCSGLVMPVGAQGRGVGADGRVGYDNTGLVVLKWCPHRGL